MAYPVRLAALTTAALLGAVALARAADYIPVQPIMDQPFVEYAPTPYYSRFDCAVAFNPTSDLRVSDPERHFVEKNGGRIETEDTWACDIGLGYYVHENFRVDTTVEYRGAFDVEGHVDPLHLPVPVPEGLRDQSTSIDSIATLFNAYLDLPGHWGWMPYVGGGIGIAYNEIDDSFDSQAGFTTRGGSSWDFAWALMAGASTPVSPDLLFDIGYRYINVGDVNSSAVGVDSVGTITATAPVRVRDIDAHELRLGFRYNFY